MFHENQVFIVQMKVNYWVQKREAVKSQLPLLKLQLPTTVVPTIDLCFPRKINACFHVEGGPNFGHLHRLWYLVSRALFAQGPKLDA